MHTHTHTHTIQPNDASIEYNSDKGIVLGLSAEGTEATYIIKALAALPPAMGNSFVATSGQIVVQPPVATPTISPDSAGTILKSTLYIHFYIATARGY